jgi:hypothetical protein
MSLDMADEEDGKDDYYLEMLLPRIRVTIRGLKAKVCGTLLQRLRANPRGVRIPRRQAQMYERLGELITNKPAEGGWI